MWYHCNLGFLPSSFTFMMDHRHKMICADHQQLQHLKLVQVVTGLLRGKFCSTHLRNWLKPGSGGSRLGNEVWDRLGKYQEVCVP